MPVYKPQQQVSGMIRIRGDNIRVLMLKNWEQAFHRYQPDIIFDDHLTSTVHGIPALGLRRSGPCAAGARDSSTGKPFLSSYVQVDPLEITIATGSYDTPYEAFALGVFVNKDKPLISTDTSAVAAIFGCCPGKNVRTWGQLGLTR